MKKNALIIMAKSPKADDVKTRLWEALGKTGSREFYSKMLDNTVSKMKGVSGADVFITYAPLDSGGYFNRYGLNTFPQHENTDIGVRMNAAIEHTLGLGYEKTVLVGADIPGLSARIASDAFRSLENADIAIGPSTDGGYYLIGMKHALPDLFQEVPWSTSEVLKTTVGKAKKMNLKMEILDILDDMDTPDDLKKFGLI